MTSPETFDRAQFQAALRSWELRFRAITESAPDAIISADSGGFIDSWNKGAEQMFGYSAEEILGRPVRTLMPERYRALHQKGLERVNAGGESRVIGSIVELAGLRKDGAEFPLELSLATWITGGERFFGGILRDITERKRTEEGLRRKTAFLELLQSVAQAANEARTPERAMVHCLTEVCALTGWPVGHVYLAEDGHVTGTDLWHLEDPERFGAFREATEGTRFPAGVGLAGRVLATGQPVWIVDIVSDENFMRRAEAEATGLRSAFAFPVLVGRQVGAVLEFFSVDAAEPDEELLEVMANIGKQIGRAIERDRAAAARAGLASIVESSDDAIIRKDLDGTILSWNAGAERLYGYSGKEAVGRSIAILVPADRPDEVPAILEKIARGEKVQHYQTERICKDGRRISVSLTISPVRGQNGEIEAASVIARDVTERERAREKLAEALEREREATERLREVDSLKTVFLQAVSHDLRTPLAAILAFGQTLERGAGRLSAEQGADVTHRIVANAKRLDRMLTGLLDLDRLSQGQIRLERRETDLGDLVCNLVEEFRSQSDRVIQAEVDSVMANVDGEKVERIVDNLLANAIRHTPPGAGVWVKVARDEGATTLVVEDSGPGVPPEAREEIFQPYRQGPATAERAMGTGVGLSLVARFAELHGGRAWVEDRPGGGASFRVFLPDADPDGSEAGQPS